VNLHRQRIRYLHRPDLQQQFGGAFGKISGTYKAGQRGQHDQERKQRHQG